MLDSTFTKPSQPGPARATRQSSREDMVEHLIFMAGATIAVVVWIALTVVFGFALWSAEESLWCFGVEELKGGVLQSSAFARHFAVGSAMIVLPLAYCTSVSLLGLGVYRITRKSEAPKTLLDSLRL